MKEKNLCIVDTDKRQGKSKAEINIVEGSIFISENVNIKNKEARRLKNENAKN